ncbi:MAG: glutamine synthetase III [Defluviitaleaceae bacterium]|nr:glutamine synthetase III [Defluviitaleaceae bacterium]
MVDLNKIFGVNVFNDLAMKQYLPKDIYIALMQIINDGKPLELDVANIVANAMKNWALERGATHFTHWFQPMTNVTAEKHESFISLSDNGRIIMDFDGRELVRGEPDASSFPTGGIRLTFEARGYTAWDPTSYAFIKNNTLCIPTAFCSYSGEALDKKTPLLRSMQALEKEALRIMRLFGHNDIKRVTATVGAEQEYFLIDKELYEKRPDLIYCGRTLFGARPAKGQEREYHYFGTIKPRVSAFMRELDEELWRLGVPAKTKHNETAPSQHELVPFHTTANIATDHNQLIMEMMKSIANKHNLACLLHEQPFEGVNGSGKHNNWSLCTDTGINLLEPGDTPQKNAQFLIFLCAIINAVDEYQDLLRIAVASANNDLRLGRGEAPSAILSIFVGNELCEILDSIENDTLYSRETTDKIFIGADVLPQIPKDSTDRNRTSPFAFTGNKFEFRMLGSSFSVADANITINAIVAEILSRFANELEQSTSFDEALTLIIKRTITNHKRVIFNGNNHTKEWILEAESRGLLNLPSTVDALPYYILPKNIAMFERHGIFSESEIRSRYEIMLEMYEKTIKIEAAAMREMVKRSIIPSTIEYMKIISETILYKSQLTINPTCELEEKLILKLSNLSKELYRHIEALENGLDETKNENDNLKRALLYQTKILEKMQELRKTIDELEKIVSREIWAYPSYGELLYSVY